MGALSWWAAHSPSGVTRAKTVSEIPLVAVVDDDESVRESLPDLLRELGFAVRAFASAGEFLASDVLDGTRCLILDVAMPGMSGRELARELLEIRPDVPILLMSGYLRPEDIDSAKRLGIREVIAKPTTIGELSEVLDRVLRP